MYLGIFVKAWRELVLLLVAVTVYDTESILPGKRPKKSTDNMNRLTW